jgi:hypothetical protein
MKNHYLLIAVALSTLLSACSTSTNQFVTKKDGKLTKEALGLEYVSSQHHVSLQAGPGVPSLAEYNHFIIDPIQTKIEDRTIPRITLRQLNEFKAHYRETLIQELLEGGYTVGTDITEKTLWVSILLSNIHLRKKRGSSRLPIERINVTVKFYQPTYNRLDAVIGSRSTGRQLLNSLFESPLSEVKSGLKIWAKGARMTIDDAHNKKTDIKLN